VLQDALFLLNFGGSNLFRISDFGFRVSDFRFIRVTGTHLERLSPEELASMIEALLQHKFSDQEGE